MSDVGPADPVTFETVAGAPAHGGSCVAHAPDGRVVFVRHALPGERVRVRVTAEHARHLQGDAIEILEPAADRVQPPCRYAGAGGCGGCDLQHVSPPSQREWKAAIIREQLSRLAGLDVEVVVEALPDVDPARPGLGWRTRLGFAVDASGRAGLHPYRSRAVVPVDACLLAHPAMGDTALLARRWRGVRTLEVAVGDTGTRRVREVRGRGGSRTGPPAALRQRALGRDFAVRGFWQVHPAAADALAGAVLGLLRPKPGERALDLYAGAGLFAAALVAVGVDVLAVEGDPLGARDAHRNLTGHPGGTAEVWQGPVDEALADPAMGALDLVVLDPPRAGAGAAVVAAIAERRPRAVVYVACDPATLARDVVHFVRAGYAVHALRAFDAFPMTHHVECVALLEPAGPVGPPA